METKKYFITLLLIFTLAYLCKAKSIEITRVFEVNNSTLTCRDTSLWIELYNSVIKIGDKVFIAEKRKIWYSIEDYMVFDQYRINKLKITFNIHPDTGEILQVDFKNLYFRP